MFEVPPSQDSEFTLWGRVLHWFLPRTGKHFGNSLLFPYWNHQKKKSCSVGDNALAFNHCQRGIFPEDSETASLWSQAAFLDVDSDGKTSQFWSTSSTGLGCITMYPCPPAIFDHHFPLVSWGPGIYLYTATCVWAYVSRDVKGQLVSLLFTFQGRSPKYWSPVIVNLTANRWVTFQKGIRISCPK